MLGLANIRCVRKRVLRLVACAVSVTVGLVVVGGAIAAAVSAEAVRACRSVDVSGGVDNGLTGGVREAHLVVKNSGAAACSLVGRPWIRLPALPHPVTVTDITDNPFAGSLSGRVLLRPGAKASALVWLNPGRCDRGASVVFGLTARVGWRGKSVHVSSPMCKDGTGHVDLGRFRHL